MKSTSSTPAIILGALTTTYHAFYAIQVIYKGIQSIFDIPMIFFAGFLDGSFNDEENIKNAQVGNEVRNVLEAFAKMEQENQEILNQAKEQKEDEIQFPLSSAPLGSSMQRSCLNPLQQSNISNAGEMTKSIFFGTRKLKQKLETKSHPNLFTKEERDQLFKYPKLQSRILQKYCSDNSIIVETIQSSNKIVGTIGKGIFSVGKYFGKFVHNCKVSFTHPFLQSGILRIIMSSVNCIVLISAYAIFFSIKFLKDAILSLTDMLLWGTMRLYDAAVQGQHTDDHNMILSDIKVPRAIPEGKSRLLYALKETFEVTWGNIQKEYSTILHYKIKNSDSKCVFTKEPQKGKNLIMRMLSNEITHQLDIIRSEWNNMNEKNNDLKKQKEEFCQEIKNALPDIKQFRKLQNEKAELEAKNDDGLHNDTITKIAKNLEPLEEKVIVLENKLKQMLVDKNLQPALQDEFSTHRWSAFLKHIETFSDTVYSVAAKLTYDIAHTGYNWISLSRVEDTYVTPGGPENQSL